MIKRICALLFFTAFAFAADVTGSWQFSVTTSMGAGSPSVVLGQKGEQLTGTFNSQIFGEVKLAGTVKGDVIEFGFEGDAGGQTVKVTFKGTVVNATSMKGTAVYAGIDDHASWSATKKP
jgi:hypothetical protein